MPPYQKNIAMLTDQQLARLFTALQVPVAVQSVLDEQTPLNDETILALHDMISCQTPDQALLSLSISSLLLDARLRASGQRCAEILAMSAEMMVQDYAPLYVEHTQVQKGTSLFDRTDLEFLESIPEDLESIGDLLSVVADVLPASLPDFRRIAQILATQASAQALVAETIVDMMGHDIDESEFVDLGALSLKTQETQNLPDNVIPFRRRS